MSTLFTSRRLRWAVPGGVAAAVAVASIGSSITASASASTPNLPARTAVQLLTALQKADQPKMSGTVVETTHLGLPDLPSSLGGSGSGGSADLSLQNFLTGSHTLRIYYGGETQQRVALLGSLSESDVIHNGKDLWTYASSTNKVTHYTLPSATAKPETVLPQTGADLTPTAEAEKALAAIDPSTTVTVDTNASVAGRSAYQLLLTPKDARSLVGSVRIALDSATSMPLRVQVFAKGARSPALQVGFTDISFRAPNASVFHFVAPAGTKTTQSKLPLVGSDVHKAKAEAGGAHTEHVLGKGWTSVVATTMSGGRHQFWDNSTARLLGKVSTKVTGGWAITSSLMSVLFTDDGRVLVGAVSVADLQKVATTGQGL